MKKCLLFLGIFGLILPLFGQAVNVTSSGSSEARVTESIRVVSSSSVQSKPKPQVSRESLLLNKLSANSKDGKTYDDLLNYYRQTGQRKMRIRMAIKAIQNVGGHLSWYKDLGDDYKAIGDYEKSLAAFQVALRIVPTSAMIYNRIGLVLLKLSHFYQSEVAFKAALYFDRSKAPSVQGVYLNNLGVSYEARNDFKEAYTYYQKAVHIYPAYQKAKDNLANVAKLIQEQGSLVQ